MFLHCVYVTMWNNSTEPRQPVQDKPKNESSLDAFSKYIDQVRTELDTPAADKKEDTKSEDSTNAELVESIGYSSFSSKACRRIAAKLFKTQANRVSTSLNTGSASNARWYANQRLSCFGVVLIHTVVSVENKCQEKQYCYFVKAKDLFFSSKQDKATVVLYGGKLISKDRSIPYKSFVICRDLPEPASDLATTQQTFGFDNQ